MILPLTLPHGLTAVDVVSSDFSCIFWAEELGQRVHFLGRSQNSGYNRQAYLVYFSTSPNLIFLPAAALDVFLHSPALTVMDMQCCWTTFCWQEPALQRLAVALPTSYQ